MNFMAQVGGTRTSSVYRPGEACNISTWHNPTSRPKIVKIADKPIVTTHFFTFHVRETGKTEDKFVVAIGGKPL